MIDDAFSKYDFPPNRCCCRFLLANCCIDLGKLADAERVLLEGTSILHKGPKEGREEILADPCPIPFGAAGLRLLGEKKANIVWKPYQCPKEFKTCVLLYPSP